MPGLPGPLALLAAAALLLGACGSFEPIPVKANNDPTGPGLLSGPSGAFTIGVPPAADERKAARP